MLLVQLAILLPALGSLHHLLPTGQRLRRLLPCLLPLCSALLLLPLLERTAPTQQWQLAFPLPEQGLVLALRVEHSSVCFGLLAALLCALVGLYAQRYLQGKPQRAQNIFFICYAIALSAFLGLSFADNMFTLYLCFELMTLVALPFIGLAGGASGLEASRTYLAYSMCGATLILFGMVLLYPYGGMSLFSAGGVVVQDSLPTCLAAYMLMALGFGCKAGLLPLHAWLPIAHPVAWTPGSALLSALMTKGGVLGILRLSYELLPMQALRGTWAQESLLLLSLLSIFVGAVLAYREQELKACLAYSSISQLSYLLLGIFLLSDLGYKAMLLQAFAHATGKGLLFLCAGLLSENWGVTRRDELLEKATGAKGLLACALLASLSMVGIAPFGGFWGKYLLLQASIQQGGILGYAAFAVLMIAACLGGLYLLYPFGRALFRGAGCVGAGGYLRKEPAYAVTLVLLSAGLIIPWLFPHVLQAVLFGNMPFSA